MNLVPGWHLIELVGHVKMVGEVAPCGQGGFFVEAIDGSARRAAPVYYGVTSIFRMFPCSEVFAKNTARSLRPEAPVLPTWAAAPPPPAAPRPTGSPQLQPDDQIGILSPGGGAIDVTFVGYLNDVAHVRVGHTLEGLIQPPRWIRRNNVTIWERAPGQYNTDMSEDIPF